MPVRRAWRPATTSRSAATRSSSLDANDRIGDQWRRRWDSLRLFSPARWDHLPGREFPAPGWSYPSGRQMADYVEAYAAWFGLPVRTATPIDRLMPAGDGSDDFIASAGDRRFRARQVIVATGAFTVPQIPEIAGQLDPAIRQIHSGGYRNPSQLADGPVLVVGVGHSGADIAFEAAATHPTILSGASHGEVPFTVLDTWRAHVCSCRYSVSSKTTSSRSGRRSVARPPHVRACCVRRCCACGAPNSRRPASSDTRRGSSAPRTASPLLARRHGARRREHHLGDRLPARLHLDRPAGHRRRRLAASRTAASRTVPGLYFVGVPFQYGVASMLIHGASRDAKYVVDRIAERVAAASHPRAAETAAA